MHDKKRIFFADFWNVKLIRYKFLCTRCIFRQRKSLQYHFGWKSWKSEKKTLKTVQEPKKTNTVPWNWAKPVEGWSYAWGRWSFVFRQLIKYTFFHWIIPCTSSWHWFWLRIFPFTWLDSPILTADCSVHLIWMHQFDYRYINLKLSSRWVWLVSGGFSLLRDIGSYLRIRRRSVLPYTPFCNWFLDYDCVLHIVNFAILYIIHIRIFKQIPKNLATGL
jgi:hypothetical protein